MAAPVPCLPDQASALLQLKRSFNTTVGDYSAAFRSWVAGTDCCHWNGVRCGGSDGHITSLDLSHRDLQASGLDDALFSLTSLEYLDISWNDFSASKLPAIGFEKLAELTHLDLCTTNFAGRVPVGIGRLKSLAYLDLSTTFFLYEQDEENSITYYYSETMSQLSEPSLETLLANLTNLEELRLGMVNMSSNGARWCDAIARSSPKLRVISMPYCSLSGPICHSLSALRSLSVIELHYNHLSGPVPELLATLSNLTVLQLSNNMLEGVFPPIIFQLQKLTSISLTNNLGISGKLPNFSAHSYLQSISVSNTNFSGTIPASISNLKYLKELALGASGFFGMLPSSIGSMPSCLTQDASALQVLSLKQNHLTGELPDNIKEGCALSALDFSGNMIQGQLPRSLVACRNLEILDIGNNQISDHFPCWMSKLPELQVLVLKSNKFHGKIMDPLYTRDGNNCQFSMLRIADIASNNFSGTLPEELFKMLKSMMTRSDNETLVMEHQYSHGQTYQFTAALTYKGNDITISKILRSLVLIDVSNNEFDGSIPSSIGELALLHGLNMSHNMLTGPIPTQFDNLNNLESLDLSSNKLSGEIPQELASLNFLATLNLSYNMLAGRIPQSSHFSTFSNASFEGNIGLCGPPLSKQCSYRSEPNIMPHASKKDPIDVLLFLFTGLGFGVCFGITILVIWGSNNRKQQA
nr:receptor-like protein 9DC3 [Oryza sativa Japonica Group]